MHGSSCESTCTPATPTVDQAVRAHGVEPLLQCTGVGTVPPFGFRRTWQKATTMRTDIHARRHSSATPGSHVAGRGRARHYARGDGLSRCGCAWLGGRCAGEQRSIQLNLNGLTFGGAYLQCRVLK